MKEQTKRRLIGAIVLAIFAVAGLSFFSLNNEGEGDIGDNLLSWQPEPPPDFIKVEVDKIPPPPQLNEIKEKLNQLKDNRQAQADSKNPSATGGGEGGGRRGIEKKLPGKNALDEIAFNDKSIPVRWVVQAASLRSPEQAQRLKQRLADNNFKSLIRALKSSKGDILYVVYVGPFLQSSRAEENQKRLKEKLKLDGILRKWK